MIQTNADSDGCSGLAASIETARLIAATIPRTSTTQAHTTASRPRCDTGGDDRWRDAGAWSRTRTVSGITTTLGTQVLAVPRNFCNLPLHTMQLCPNSST